MKKIKFLVMALVALTIASCSKEEAVSDVQGGKAKVTVNIIGQEDPVGSRASGPSDDATDAKVNNYIIFLFNDGGGLIGTPKYVTGSAAGTVDDATTAAKNIYIVANTGDPTVAGHPLKDVTSLANLKTRAGDLIKSDNSSSQDKTNLWMVGTGTVGKFTPGVGKDDPSNATGTVTMTFLSARIDVVIKDERNHTTPADGVISIKDDQVALLFAGAKGKFFATAAEQVEQTTFFSGLTNYPDPEPSTLAAVLADNVTTAFTENAAGTVGYHFYTFGNKGTTMPTILTIKSTRTDANKATKSIYYPIRFSDTDAGKTIEPGNKYLVTLTLTGDVNNGGGGGTTDPEEELKAADITVTVTPAKWPTKIDVDKTFN